MAGKGKLVSSWAKNKLHAIQESIKTEKKSGAAEASTNMDLAAAAVPQTSEMTDKDELGQIPRAPTAVTTSAAAESIASSAADAFASSGQAGARRPPIPPSTAAERSPLPSPNPDSEPGGSGAPSAASGVIEGGDAGSRNPRQPGGGGEGVAASLKHLLMPPKPPSPPHRPLPGGGSGSLSQRILNLYPGGSRTASDGALASAAAASRPLGLPVRVFSTRGAGGSAAAAAAAAAATGSIGTVGPSGAGGAPIAVACVYGSAKLGQVRLVQQLPAHDGVVWAAALHQVQHGLVCFCKTDLSGRF